MGPTIVGNLRNAEEIYSSAVVIDRDDKIKADNLKKQGYLYGSSFIESAEGKNIMKKMMFLPTQRLKEIASVHFCGEHHLKTLTPEPVNNDGKPPYYWIIGDGDMIGRYSVGCTFDELPK